MVFEKMSESFNEELLKMKRTKFLETVRAACDEYRIEYPYVNMRGCPEEAGNLSHFHPDLYTICISDRQLNMLNFDDITEVATHEVTHIFEPNHCSRFVDIHTDMKTKTWKPPKGLFVISSDTRKNKKVKLSRRESTASIGNRECNYYYCVKNVGLKQCEYCHDWFCESHMAPVMIGIADLAHERIRRKPSYDEWRLFLRDRRFHEERGHTGHPCPDYERSEEQPPTRLRTVKLPESMLDDSSKIHYTGSYGAVHENSSFSKNQEGENYLYYLIAFFLLVCLFLIWVFFFNK